MPIDLDRIAAIAAREKVATKGPWFYVPDTMTGGLDGGDISYTEYGRPKWRTAGYTPNTYKDNAADGEFLAHAREDIPWLLQQIALLMQIDGPATLDMLIRQRDAAVARVARLETGMRRLADDTRRLTPEEVPPCP